MGSACPTKRLQKKAEDDSKKAKTYADMLEEEEIKKEAEVKKEENRIKRENIWKKRTVSNCFFSPFQKLQNHTFRWMPSLKRQWQHTGGEEPRGSLVEGANINFECSFGD